MNTRINTNRSVEEGAVGGNQAPAQALAAGVQVLINQDVLTDGEVRVTLF